MIRRILLIAAVALSISLSRHSFAGALKAGDPAPALKVGKFVKGPPITKFQRGKIYVIEFWATWCGPCKMTIPHLTEMAKKHKDVQFIGVSVWEHSQTGVEPFVKEMGSKMDYTVAMDSIPAGKDANQGFMAENWMRAAGQGGIPAAFIVNKEGRVAWIGHPMTMDAPLAKIVSGTWNTKQEADRANAVAVAQRKMQSVGMSLNSAMQSKDYAKALSITNGAIAETPQLEQFLGPLKLDLLGKLNKTADAHTYLAHLIEGPLKENAAGLNQVAWTIVDPAKPKPNPSDAQLALKSALRADQLANSKEPAIIDTLAAAYHATGNRAKAVEKQELVMKLAKGTPLERDPSLKAHLDLYKKGK
jgi:thiol-disulfide isomerase/thioredoxin